MGWTKVIKGVFFIFVKLSKSYGKILGKGNLNLVQFVLKLHTFSGMQENPIFRNPTHHYTIIVFQGTKNGKISAIYQKNLIAIYQKYLIALFSEFEFEIIFLYGIIN